MGVFGVYYQPIMRHWALWGVIPLDKFYLAMLVLGVGLLVANSPLAPWTRVDRHEPPALALITRPLRLLRAGIALALMSGMVWLALTH